MRLGKFGAVGILGAAVQMALFWVLTRWLPTAGAAAIAVELTVLHNFLWHERLTWRDRAATGVWKRLLRFHAANGVVSIAGNAAMVRALTAAGIPAVAAQAAAIAVCAPLNYLVADRWVYAA
jgi:dolichol-phosphate mannosyltransferase